MDFGKAIIGMKVGECATRLSWEKGKFITKQIPCKLEGVTVLKDVKSCVALLSNSENVFIIGGGQIYKEFLNLVNTLYITEIGIEIENADTYFPKIDSNNWDLISTKGEVENGCKLIFKKYIKIH